jgi:hypothetical protein
MVAGNEAVERTSERNEAYSGRAQSRREGVCPLTPAYRGGWWGTNTYEEKQHAGPVANSRGCRKAACTPPTGDVTALLSSTVVHKRRVESFGVPSFGAVGKSELKKNVSYLAGLSLLSMRRGDRCPVLKGTLSSMVQVSRIYQFKL